MGSYEWRKWLRVNGFGRDHPDPDADLGYDGEYLQTVTLTDADTGEYDYWVRDPGNDDRWVFATDDVLIEDLEAWA